MDGRLILLVFIAICGIGFLHGYRMSRMTTNPMEGQLRFGLPLQAKNYSASDVNGIGRFLMFLSSLFLMIVTAACFGLLGPIDGIQTISLN